MPVYNKFTLVYGEGVLFWLSGGAKYNDYDTNGCGEGLQDLDFLGTFLFNFLKSDGEHAVFEFGLDAFFVDRDG